MSDRHRCGKPLPWRAPRPERVNIQAGLLAHGSSLGRPSRVAPVVYATSLTVHSCGGSHGLGHAPLPYSLFIRFEAGTWMGVCRDRPVSESRPRMGGQVRADRCCCRKTPCGSRQRRGQPGMARGVRSAKARRRMIRLPSTRPNRSANGRLKWFAQPERARKLLKCRYNCFRQ